MGGRLDFRTVCDCVPLMRAGAGTHQICPLHTVERLFVPNMHYLSQIRAGGPDAKCLAQGRDLWLLVILAAEQAVGEF